MNRGNNKQEKRMKIFRSLVLFVGICVFSVYAFPKGLFAGDFTQTFYIRIGGIALNSGDETTLAKYDKVMCNRFHYDDIGGDTWGAIHTINANCEIYLYQQGRSTDSDDDNEPYVQFTNNLARYNISRGHSQGSLNGDNSLPIGVGFEGFFLTDRSGNRLTHIKRPQNPIMDFGNPDFRDYWVEATTTDFVGRSWEADGIWVDLCTIHPTAISAWPRKYNKASWATAMNGFINAISAGLQPKGQKIWCNRTMVNKDDDCYNKWVNLDSVANPPDAALDEAAFACEFGTGDVQFFPEAHWKRLADVMGAVSNYDVCLNASSGLKAGESGTDNHGKPVTYYDVLWYALASYQLGKNTTDNNSYFSMQIGTSSYSYCNVGWHDEYDHIDLGRATAKYKITNYSGNNIYWREFEKGYVYVNPTKYDVSSISLPKTCKQLTHDNFKNDPTTIPSINTINLKAHRAALLLKNTNDDITFLSPPANFCLN